MTHTNYNDALFQEEARVAAIYPIGMMGDPEPPPKWLEEMFEEFTGPEHSLFKALPELKPDAGEASEWADSLFMSGRAGLLVIYEACIRQYVEPPSTAFYSGWGLYRTGYLHVETFHEIGPAVLKVVREQHDAERPTDGAA